MGLDMYPSQNLMGERTLDLIKSPTSDYSNTNDFLFTLPTCHMSADNHRFEGCHFIINSLSTCGQWCISNLTGSTNLAPPLLTHQEYKTSYCFSPPDDSSCLGNLCKTKSYNRLSCVYCMPDHLVQISVLCIEVYVIDKTWCEYEPNHQTTDYAINARLIWSKTPVSNATSI